MSSVMRLQKGWKKPRAAVRYIRQNHPAPVQSVTRVGNTKELLPQTLLRRST